MNEPTVSVVVPVRDRRELLVRLLESLEAQTYPSERIEVIVVDNGSSDGSGRAARRFADGAPFRVRVFDERTAGAVAARNRGAREAVGDVLAFTDSDCRPVPRWIECGARAIGSADVVQGETRADPRQRRGPLDRTVEGGAGTGLYDTCNLFVRTSVFREAGGFDEAFVRTLRLPRSRRQLDSGFGEDTELVWRLARRGCRVAGAADAVVHHHVFSPSLPDALARTWMAGAFPALVRSVPELRGTLLRRGLFLTAERPWFYLAMAGLLGGRRPSVRAAAALPYLAARLRSVPGTRTERLRALPALAGLDAVATAALAIGSAASRSPVL